MHFGQRRQRPTVVNAISCNITDNIAVTIKCVRNKFCASTTQLVHKWQRITQRWKQITMCVICKCSHVRLSPLRLQTTQTFCTCHVLSKFNSQTPRNVDNEQTERIIYNRHNIIQNTQLRLCYRWPS